MHGEQQLSVLRHNDAQRDCACSLCAKFLLQALQSASMFVYTVCAFCLIAKHVVRLHMQSTLVCNVAMLVL